MHAAQDAVYGAWRGIGLSTDQAAVALLGSHAHLEYTLVGGTVNLAQRLQQGSGAGQTTPSDRRQRGGQSRSSLRPRIYRLRR